MYWNNLLRLIALLLIICSGFTTSAQNGWEINPNSYVYSMTITGKLKVDGTFSVNTNDTIAAFIDGECRGLTTVKYQSALNEYFVYLMVYSNDPNGNISFKADVADKDTILNINESMDFDINSIVGSINMPFQFTVNSATYESKMLSFSLPGQTGSRISGSSVYVSMKLGANLRNLVATFSLSEEAVATVNGITQHSKVTKNNFTSSVKYQVIAPDPSVTKTYTIYAQTAKDTPSDIVLSNNIVSENIDSVMVGDLSIEGAKIDNNHDLSLNSGYYDNDMFYLENKKLYIGEAANFEEKPVLHIRVKASDGVGGELVKDFKINVLDADDQPQGIVLSRDTISEGAQINSLIAKIIVLDEDENDQYSFELIAGDGTNDVSNSHFTLSNDSLILAKEVDTINSDKMHFLIKVSNDDGYLETRAFVLHKVSQNMAPDIISIPVNYAIEDQVYVYGIQANDMEGDQVEIQFDKLPDWLTFNSDLNLLSGTPYNENVGIVSFKVIASDGKKNDVQIVVIQVINVNDPPEINYFINEQVFKVNRENELEVPTDCFIDSDINDKLTFTLWGDNNTALPSWLYFDEDKCLLSGIPSTEDLGSYNLKLTAKDRSGNKEWMVFTLNVTIATSLIDVFDISEVKVYPNPVEDHLNIEMPSYITNCEASIKSMAGQFVQNVILIGGNNRIRCESLTPGVYILEIVNGSCTVIQKIIKN